MAIQQQTLALSFGLLGNIVSFITFLAPMPTFYQIYRKKSTEGFQSIPYLVSLLSAMLLIYYGLLKDDILLIAINAFGCFIETAYTMAYLIYSSRIARMETMRMMGALNMMGYGIVVAGTMYWAEGENRVTVVGWICMVFSLCVFAAPLCIITKVIKTKSVEFMPLPLSVFLTLGAVMWFFYGLFKRDKFIFVPNILGFLLGLAQIGLYFIVKQKNTMTKSKLMMMMMMVEDPFKAVDQELTTEQIIDVVCPQLNTVLRDITESYAIEVVGQVNTQDDDDVSDLKETTSQVNKDNNIICCSSSSGVVVDLFDI